MKENKKAETNFTKSPIFHIRICQFSYVHLHRKCNEAFSKAPKGIITQKFFFPISELLQDREASFDLKKT